MPKRKRYVLEVFAYIFASAGLIILISLLLKSCAEGINPFGKTDFELSSRFGDFVAGTVGTLFAFAGTLFIFLTFREQQKENSRKQFEEVFYEMIRIHRENVEQLIYEKKDEKNERILTDRLVIKEIVDEFLECYKEVKKLLKPIDLNEHLTPGYKKHLGVVNRINGISVRYDMYFLIDICYCVTFFGMGHEGSIMIKEKFKKKITGKTLGMIILYLQLKPKKSNKNAYRLWKKVTSQGAVSLNSLLFNVYESTKGRGEVESDLARAIISRVENFKYKKYYGGHQHRLGHYFRHLYQSFKILDSSLLIKREDRYGYGKILRAQLSTYEQILLFINSISTLGKKWELIKDNSEFKNDFISFYQLIKNVPGTKLLDISYRSFYKRIRLEALEEKY